MSSSFNPSFFSSCHSEKAGSRISRHSVLELKWVRCSQTADDINNSSNNNNNLNVIRTEHSGVVLTFTTENKVGWVGQKSRSTAGEELQVRVKLGQSMAVRPIVILAQAITLHQEMTSQISLWHAQRLRYILQYSAHCDHFLTCSHCQEWLQAELIEQLRAKNEEIKFLRLTILDLRQELTDLREQLLRVEARAVELWAGGSEMSESSKVDSLLGDNL